MRELALFYIAQVLCCCCLSVEENPVESLNTELNFCFGGSSPSQAILRDFQLCENRQRVSLMQHKKTLKEQLDTLKKNDKVMFA